MSFKETKIYKWFDNFWYHYKWIAIVVSIFAVFIIVSTVQMAIKEDGDIYVMYAGPAVINVQNATYIERAFENIDDTSGYTVEVTAAQMSVNRRVVVSPNSVTVTDFTVEEGKTYNIKIEVDGIMVRGYIDDVLQFEYQAESTSRAEAYQVVSTDEETGDIIIKLVNVTSSDRVFAINIENAEIESTATVYQVSGDSLNNDNILGAKEDCVMEEFSFGGFSEKFNYTVPQYSVTAIRLHTK